MLQQFRIRGRERTLCPPKKNVDLPRPLARTGQVPGVVIVV